MRGGGIERLRETSLIVRHWGRMSTTFNIIIYSLVDATTLPVTVGNSPVKQYSSSTHFMSNIQSVWPPWNIGGTWSQLSTTDMPTSNKPHLSNEYWVKRRQPVYGQIVSVVSTSGEQCPRRVDGDRMYSTRAVSRLWLTATFQTGYHDCVVGEHIFDENL